MLATVENHLTANMQKLARSVMKEKKKKKTSFTPLPTDLMDKISVRAKDLVTSDHILPE